MCGPLVALGADQFAGDIGELPIRELAESHLSLPATVGAVDHQPVIALGFDLAESHWQECSNTPIRKMKGAAKRIGRTRFIKGIAETQKRGLGGVE